METYSVGHTWFLELACLPASNHITFGELLLEMIAVTSATDLLHQGKLLSNLTPDVREMHEFNCCCSRKPTESQFAADD